MLDRTIAASLLALTTTACMFMGPKGPSSSQTAENPLVSGHDLEATHPGDVGVVSAEDCNIWPFEDRMTVRASEQEICVSVHKHVQAPPGWTGEPNAARTEGFKIVTDPAREGIYINAEKSHPAKVGSCFNKGFNEQIAIWAFDYDGCEPNNGTLTATSPSLIVGDEEWTFPAAAGAAPPPAAK